MPAELVERRRWVRRDADKVPLQPNGRRASSTQPYTWSTYQRAARAADVGVGLGYVLAAGDGVVCLDLDHCLDEGRLAPWARAILERCGSTFVEISPSGRGLHVFGRGPAVVGRKVRGADGLAVEVYSQGRYIAVTGRRWRGAPLRLGDLSEVVASFTA